MLSLCFYIFRIRLWDYNLRLRCNHWLNFGMLRLLFMLLRHHPQDYWYNLQASDRIGARSSNCIRLSMLIRILVFQSLWTPTLGLSPQHTHD